MDESPDLRRDDDFHAPPVRSLTVLVASVRERVLAGVNDAALIEDLRLLILARLYQGASQREIEDEMQGWGIDSEYAVELVCSTRSAGTIGEMEMYTDLSVDGISAGRYHNPAYRLKVRAAERAERRNNEARRMVDAENGSPTVNLGFEVKGPATRQSVAAQNYNHLLLVWAILIVIALIFSAWLMLQSYPIGLH